MRSGSGGFRRVPEGSGGFRRWEAWTSPTERPAGNPHTTVRLQLGHAIATKSPKDTLLEPKGLETKAVTHPAMRSHVSSKFQLDAMQSGSSAASCAGVIQQINGSTQNPKTMTWGLGFGGWGLGHATELQGHKPGAAPPPVQGYLTHKKPAPPRTL